MKLDKTEQELYTEMQIAKEQDTLGTFLVSVTTDPLKDNFNITWHMQQGERTVPVSQETFDLVDQTDDLKRRYFNLLGAYCKISGKSWSRFT